MSINKGIENITDECGKQGVESMRGEDEHEGVENTTDKSGEHEGVENTA